MKRTAAWVLGFMIGGVLAHLIGYVHEKTLVRVISFNASQPERHSPAATRLVVLAS